MLARCRYWLVRVFGCLFALGGVGGCVGGELLRRVVGVARRVFAIGLALAGLATPAASAAPATTTATIAIAVTTITGGPALAVGACTFTFAVGCFAALLVACLLVASRLVVAIFGRTVRSALVVGKFLAGSPGSPVRAFTFGAVAPAAAAAATAATTTIAAFAFLVGRAFTALAALVGFAGVAILDIVRLVADRCLA
jgi:hypothetical protein